LISNAPALERPSEINPPHFGTDPTLLQINNNLQPSTISLSQDLFFSRVLPWVPLVEVAVDIGVNCFFSPFPQSVVCPFDFDFSPQQRFQLPNWKTKFPLRFSLPPSPFLPPFQRPTLPRCFYGYPFCYPNPSFLLPGMNPPFFFPFLSPPLGASICHQSFFFAIPHCCSIFVSHPPFVCGSGQFHGSPFLFTL